MKTLRGLAGALGLAAGVAADGGAQCLAPVDGAAYDFKPAPYAVFETDFSDANGPRPPRGMKILEGSAMVVTRDGQRMLEATSETIVLVPLTTPLSDQFSIEIGYIHRDTKQVGAATITAYGGTNRVVGPSSSSIKVHAYTSGWWVEGGGLPANREATFAGDEADSCKGQPSVLRIAGDGGDISVYMDERPVVYLSDAKWRRTGGVVIHMEGRGGEGNQVYLTRIRIAGTTPTQAIASNAQGAAAPPPPPPPAQNPAALPITVKPGSEPAQNPAALPITVKPANEPSPIPVEKAPVAAAPQQTPEATQSSTATTTTATTTAGTKAISTAQPRPMSGTSAAGAAAASADPTPVAPSVVRASYAGEGQILVAWQSVPGATGYNILFRMPNGQWAGANRLDVGNAGVADTLAFTRDLSPGTYPIAVASVYDAAGAIRSNPSSTVTVNVPRWGGRYQVTVNGFRAHRTTIDDPLNYDGKGDEIYVTAAVQERDASGPVGSRRLVRSHVHGDQNHAAWRNNLSPEFRVAAGSAPGGLGGLQTGDQFPANPLARAGGVSDETFPLRLWEGELYEGMQMVEIVPELWETDDKPTAPTGKGYSAYASAVIGVVSPLLRPPTSGPITSLTEALARRAYRRVVPAWWSDPENFDAFIPRVQSYSRLFGNALVPESMWPYIGGANKANAVLAEYAAAMSQQMKPALTSSVNAAAAAYQLLLNSKDRQIGLVERNGRLVYFPRWLVLDQPSAEAIIAGDASLPLPQGFSIRQPGILEIRFTDTAAGGNGDYSLYVEVRRTN